MILKSIAMVILILLMTLLQLFAAFYVTVGLSWMWMGIRMFAFTLIPSLVIGWFAHRRFWIAVLWWAPLSVSSEAPNLAFLAEIIGVNILIFALLSLACLIIGAVLRRVTYFIETTKKLILLGIIVIFIGISFLQYFSAERWPKDYSRINKVQALDNLHSMVMNYYPYLEIKNIDLESHYKRIRKNTKEDMTNYDYALIIADYLSILNDGHASVRNEHLQRNHYGVPGICLTRANGKIVIEKVIDDKSKQKRLSPGMIITAVDGIATEQAILNIPKFLTAGGKAWKEFQVWEFLLAGPRGTTVTITINDPEGQEDKVALKRNRWVWNTRELKCNLNKARLISDNIGYIPVPFPFDRNCLVFFKKELEKMCNCEYLILDVRGNAGGNDPIACKINGYLFEKPVYYGYFFSSKLPQENQSRTIRPAKWIYSGKVIILVDEACFSTCTAFLGPHVLTNRSILVGRPIGGGGGNPSRGLIKMPGGTTVRFSLAAFLDPEGEDRVETQTFQPDIRVERTIEAIAEGRDQTLEAALDYIRSLVKEASAQTRSALLMDL